MFGGYAAWVTIVTPAVIAPTITRDPADDQVLAAVLAAQADLIVSEDAHGLDLKTFHGIEIVTAAVAVERVEAAAWNDASTEAVVAVRTGERACGEGSVEAVMT